MGQTNQWFMTVITSEVFAARLSRPTGEAEYRRPKPRTRVAQTEVKSSKVSPDPERMRSAQNGDHRSCDSRVLQTSNALCRLLPTGKGQGGRGWGKSCSLVASWRKRSTVEELMDMVGDSQVSHDR